MSMLTIHKCPNCGGNLTLDCGEVVIRNDDGVELLDLLLICENDCGARTLNAFVPTSEFFPVAEWKYARSPT